MGPTDFDVTYPGWNLDDIEIWAIAQPQTDTCTNGIQDPGEDRIDCGGPCPPCDCTTDGACDNGLYCDGSETCDQFGECQSGTAVDCPDDGLFCNGTEFCDESADTCGHTGEPCTPPEVCDEVADTCGLVSTTIVSAASCATHDLTAYCMGLELAGAATIEPRLPGVTRLALVTADAVAADSTTASATCLNETYVGAVVVTSDDTTSVTVDLDALPDQDCCTLEFFGGIEDSLTVSTLVGDVNQDGANAASDAGDVKSRLGQVLDELNFLYDVNVDGTITASDLGDTKARLGNVTPICP
jgi:hypothetical protein